MNDYDNENLEPITDSNTSQSFLHGQEPAEEQTQPAEVVPQPAVPDN